MVKKVLCVLVLKLLVLPACKDRCEWRIVSIGSQISMAVRVVQLR